MQVGLFFFGATKEPYMQKRFIEILDKNEITFCMLNPNNADFWESVSVCDAVIMHYGQYRTQLEQASTFMPLFENYFQKNCFPNSSTGWHYDDKIKQFYLLSLAGFNYIPCHIFYQQEDAIKFAEQTSYPIVFKLRGGAGSSNVRLLHSLSEARLYINKMFRDGVFNSMLEVGIRYDLQYYGLKRFAHGKLSKLYHYLKEGYVKTDFWGIEKDYILFQDFCAGNTYDTRITVIGNRAFGFRRMNRKNDFRASGSGKIDWEKSKVDLGCVKMAFSVSGHFSFQSMAYDFVYDREGNPAICEISYTYNDLAIHTCSGYWDRDLSWHEGHFWPQYCNLSDLLKDPQLKNIE